MNKVRIKKILFYKDGELILVKHGNDVEIPHGDTLLKKGDVVTVMGTQTAIEDFRDKFTGA